VAVGGKAVFTAYIPSAPTTTNFTWAVTGGSANGTITADGTGKGDYVAPAAIPTGAVTITVTSGSLGGSATVTIGAAATGGVAISPGSIAVQAGTTFQFSATSNGGPATVTQWEVNGTPLGDTLHGSIDSNGNYTAPAMPPPGGSTTITAITTGGSANATATVVFSNNSLSGPYAFSYTGVDSSGYLAVAGSFTANNGVLTGGEDATNNAQPFPTTSISGSTYSIGPDGRGTVTIIGGAISEKTWEIALAGNPSANPGGPAQHAVLVRFDLSATGSGTIDQQNMIEAESATPFPAGNYVFGLSGLDGALLFKDGGNFTLAAAGKFFSNGNGTTVTNASVWDLNDAGFTGSTGIVTDDTTLNVSYVAAPGSISGSVGRGTLNLISTNATLNSMTGVTLPASNTFSFVFYVVDNTHMKVIENDGHAFLSGDIFSGPSTSDGSFTQAGVLKNGNYAFTLGGATRTTAYSAGGVFAANGSGQTATGVMDVNNGGVQILLDKILTTSYTVDPNLGRISFILSPSGVTPGYTFAGYTTSSGSVEIVETDSVAVTSGVAFPQAATSEPSGSFAANISGASASGEQDAGGQVVVNNGAVAGTLDFNNAVNGTVDLGLELLSGTTIATPDSNGRGTAMLDTSATNFQLVYYVIDARTVLMMETDGVHVVLGKLSAQY
jgi:hypothetical protein